ncbi:MAG: hypothetical protein O8C59_02325 [Candidatus Methanoperedens sp.]|nr:hypothetical protein [Candidatus Methanoperedens sp.]
MQIDPMRKSGITIALLIMIAIVVSGCLSNSEAPVDLSAPRENSDEGVKITVTYLPDITDATAFDIQVTSHKDYNDDFRNNSYLRDSSGKTYEPLSYEGEGGHHASGTLRFPKIEGMRFELVIQDVAEVKERVFKW